MYQDKKKMCNIRDVLYKLEKIYIILSAGTEGRDIYILRRNSNFIISYTMKRSFQGISDDLCNLFMMLKGMTICDFHVLYVYF